MFPIQSVCGMVIITPSKGENCKPHLRQTQKDSWILGGNVDHTGEIKIISSGWRKGTHRLIFQRTWAGFPTPTSGNSKLPITAAPGSSPVCGLYGHLDTYTHLRIIETFQRHLLNTFEKERSKKAGGYMEVRTNSSISIRYQDIIF